MKPKHNVFIRLKEEVDFLGGELEADKVAEPKDDYGDEAGGDAPAVEEEAKGEPIEGFDEKALQLDFPTGLVPKETWIVDKSAIPRRVDKSMAKLLELGFGHVGQSGICLFHRPA